MLVIRYVLTPYVYRPVKIEPGQNDKFFHDAFELMGEQLKYVKIIRNRDNK